jgi:hypothetical protein
MFRRLLCDSQPATATSVNSRFYIYATNSSSSADETSLETEYNTGFVGFNMVTSTYDIRNYTLDSASGHVYDGETSDMLAVWPGHGNNVMLASPEDIKTNGYVPVVCVINADETLSCSYQQSGSTFSGFYMDTKGSSQYLNIGQVESDSGSSASSAGEAVGQQGNSSNSCYSECFCYKLARFIVIELAPDRSSKTFLKANDPTEFVFHNKSDLN